MFWLVPLPQEQNTARKWITRVNRVPEHNNRKAMYVCSEHFEDDNFSSSNRLQADLMNDELLIRHNIKLNDDAVPNTGRKVHSSWWNFQNTRKVEMPFVSDSKFYELASKWVCPAICKYFARMRTEIMTELQVSKNSVLCGDAQFDSPGFSATFCTYTIMDCANDKVVDTIIMHSKVLNLKFL